MKIPDDKMEEFKRQTMVDNSRLEELIKEMDEGFIGPGKREEFNDLLKKSQLFMPVVFSQNMEDAVENSHPGEIFVPEGQVGFDINYIKLAGNERAVPLFTSEELIESVGLQSSTIAIFMSDLVKMLKESNRYSLVAINPFTDLLVQIPFSSFLALFNEMSAEQKEAMDKLIRLLKTQSISTPQNIKVVFRDNENYMKKQAINGLFAPSIPFKASSFPNFQKELKYTNIILIPKNKKILYLGGIVSKDVFDTIIAPETEFELVEEIDEFTTIWKIGKQPFYDELNNEINVPVKDFKYWFGKANDLIKQGEYEKSLECFDKAIELNPAESLLWYMKGRVLIDLNRCDEAIELLDKAFDLNPLYVRSLATKGIAYEKLGKYNEAMACYDEAIILDPKDDYAFGLKGTLFLIGLKDYDNAIKYLNQAKKINPKNSMTWNNLGDAYLNKKEFEEALNCCDKARSLDSNNFRAWFTTGEIYYELGDYAKSIEYAMEAEKLNPSDIDLLMFIGKVKEAIDDEKSLIWGVDLIKESIPFNEEDIDNNEHLFEKMMYHKCIVSSPKNEEYNVEVRMHFKPFECDSLYISDKKVEELKDELERDIEEIGYDDALNKFIRFYDGLFF